MSFLFSIFSFLLPLTFYSGTSELFEFNKTVLLYSFTVIICGFWLANMISQKKIIFRRTLLDIPLGAFLVSQFISSLISIDMRTSILGYYSRFNGGLLSLICYSLLYWAYVSHMNKKESVKIIKITLVSGVLVSIYATLEHFGHSPSCLFITHKFDVGCWVQDVQLRVFATFGQPNWLGAWLAALIPLTWALSKNKITYKTLKFHFLAVLFFLVLLFTKSRSAILGFAVANVIYWALNFWTNKNNPKAFFQFLLPVTAYLVLTALIIGTPWSPNISEYLSKEKSTLPTINSFEETISPTIQRGGTESGDIRKIVWKGAWENFKAYPIFGSGVETFAYSYYQFRPVEHNNVSEWNFLYNKAHNEYLNFLATTGVVGLTTYLIVIITAIFILTMPISPLNTALLAGFASILVSNFFGFSVVPVSYLTFIFPAVAVSLRNSKIKKQKIKADTFRDMNNQQKTGILFVLLAICYILFCLARYWYADTLYAQANSQQKAGNLRQSQEYIEQAIKITPDEPVFHDLLANNYFLSAQSSYKSGDKEIGDLQTQKMDEVLDQTHRLSPRNVKLVKSGANMYSNISNYNTTYLNQTFKYLEFLEQLAPTDASVYYIKALSMAKLDQPEQAMQLLEKTIAMRINYKNARLLYAILLSENDQKDKARAQLDYINKYISTNDTQAATVAEEYGL